MNWCWNVCLLLSLESHFHCPQTPKWELSRVSPNLHDISLPLLVCVIAASEDAPRLGIDFRKFHYATSTKPNPLRARARNGPTGQQNRCVAYRQIRLQRRKKSWFCPHDTSGIVESLNLRVETRLNHKGQGIILVSPLKSNGFCPRVKQEIYTKRKCPIPAVWETQARQYSRG